MAAYNSSAQYSRQYENLRGVDLTSGQTQVAPQRFAWAQNMWKDYATEQGGAIETMPGFRQINAWSGKTVYGIWTFKPAGGEMYVLIHAGDTLYQFRHADRDLIAKNSSLIKEYGGLADAQSNAFVFNGRFYILDGDAFKVFMKGENGEWSLKNAEEEAYIPVTFVNGEIYEQRNMLIDKTYNRETQAAEFYPDPYYKIKYGALVGFADDYRSDGVVLLPGTVDSVSAIAAGAFENNETIEKVILGSCDDTGTAILRIGARSFKGCHGLKSVEILAGEIGTEAFAGCTSIEKVSVYGSYYTSVLDEAFSQCTKIREVYVNGSVSGDAFNGCTSIETVKLDGYGTVSNDAFSGCDAIKEIYLGEKTSFEGPSEEDGDFVYNHFGSLASIEKVYTALSESDIYDYEYEPNYPELEQLLSEMVNAGAEIVYETPTETEPGRSISSLIERQAIVYDKADSVEQVHIDDDVMDRRDWYTIYHTLKGEEYVERVVMLEDKDADVKLTDMFIDVELNCKASEFSTVEGYLDFSSANEEYKGTATDAITKCTKSASFDGRIFLTGNPELPNTVFYCSRDDTGHANPLYWGTLNYINDGVGLSPNTAMLATADMLMVLKGNDTHDATIYYHRGVDTENDVIPRIYPSERGLSGVGCVGTAVNFRDDAVFLSPTGLEAVGKQQVNLERTLAHRSTLVDRMMAREDLPKARAVEWEGYLMLFMPSGMVYMADSRQIWQNGENVEYEWYLLSDIGVYDGQTEDFEQITGDGMLYDEEGGHWLSDEFTEAYAAVDGKRYEIGPMPDEPVFIPSEKVYMSYLYRTDSGSDVWYLDPELTEQARLPVALIGEYAYIVTESGRYSGGEFKSVSAVSDVDGVLYFGTENGSLCCFNTDKRGLSFHDAPVAVGAIHPNWYTFNGRQIDSYITTAYDSAGFPDLAKKTVKKSLVVHAKTFPGSRIEVRVRTDRNEEWRSVRDNYEDRWSSVGQFGDSRIPVRTNHGEKWNSVDTVSTATYDFYAIDYESAPLQLAEAALTTIREKEKKWAYKQLYFGSVGFRSPWGLYSAGYRFTVTGRIKT